MTQEPTHTDEEGNIKPGSQSPDSIITPKLMREAQEIWRESMDEREDQSNRSSHHPHITDNYSPLESLCLDAFEEFGNMSADTMDGNLKRKFIRYANRIVEDVRLHPYGSTPNLDYYTSLQDTRPIPDIIMEHGLAYHYAKWKNSTKATTAFAEYHRILNSVLFQRKFGSGKIQMNTVDKDQGPIR